jgi:hypothetical protein
VAKKIQNEEEGEQQKKTIYLEVGKKTQPKKTALSSRPVYGTIRTAVAARHGPTANSASPWTPTAIPCPPNTPGRR